MVIKSIETFSNTFVSLVRVRTDDGAEGPTTPIFLLW